MEHAPASHVRLAAIFRRGGLKAEVFGDSEPPPDPQTLQEQLQRLAVAWATPKSRYVELQSNRCVAPPQL
jgi:hypothetical protein